MSWKSRLPFLAVKPVAVHIGEHDYNFYPMSLGLAFKLKGLAKPLAQALQTLFSGNNNDVGSLNRQFSNDKGTFDSEMKVESITPELATLRTKQMTDALGALIDGITAVDNLEMIANIVMDSMRETFEDKSQRPPAIEFINETPIPALFQMLGGVFKANKGIFGPVGDSVGKALTALKLRVEKEIATKVEAKAEMAKETVPTVTPAPIATANGS